jgi:hypothetical protein
MKKSSLILTFAALALALVPSCQTATKQPDPIDALIEYFPRMMFDLPPPVVQAQAQP